MHWLSSRQEHVSFLPWFNAFFFLLLLGSWTKTESWPHKIPGESQILVNVFVVVVLYSEQLWTFFPCIDSLNFSNFVYSMKCLMRTLSFTFVFRCLLLVSLSYQIVCFKGQSSQLFIFTVISLLIYISIGLITLLTKMRIMNWYTGKS